MSLLFNILSRFIIAFLPRSKNLLISWLESPSAVILEPKKRKSIIVSTFSLSICHKVMGPDATILVFSMLSFKPGISLSFFTLIKRLFNSSSLSAIRVVSSEYLRVLTFLLIILIPVYVSSNLAFHIMYTAYKLTEQGDNKPVSFSMSNFNCCFLTCIQISQEIGKVVWYSHLFKNFPQFIAIHTVKGF